MRPLHAVWVASFLAAAALGCSLVGKNSEPRSSSSTVQKVSADQLVKYLDERAARLQTVSSDVQFTAHDGLLALNLRGYLSAQQPQNFRMTGKATVAGSVDLGSNNDQFWIYVDAPMQKPLFVYASHSDFEAGRAKLPGGIPFEPEWVMQALGMHNFPSNLGYSEPTVNQSERTYTLSWHAKTPNGMAIQKEVVFEADEAREGKPQVKKHLIRDSKNKLICSAEVKAVKTLMLGSADPRSGQLPVQYPTHIILHWEAQKFDLDLTLTNVQINQRFPDEQARRLFSRPADFPGAPALDLAKYEFTIR